MFFRVIARHLMLCGISFILFRLVLMGPEGGILMQYISGFGAEIIMSITTVLQIIVLNIYMDMGKKICSFKKSSLLSVVGISSINMIVILVIYLINGHNIKGAINLFSVFGNAPFFVISSMYGDSFSIKIILVFMASILIFTGNSYACWRNRSQKGHLDG